MRKCWLLLLLCSVPILARSQATNLGYNPSYVGTGNGCQTGGTCYYVDYDTGSDSNNGTSKATPWKTAPGMPCAAGVPKAHTLTSTDEIILKGGVTWPPACQGWNVVNGGRTSAKATGYPGLYIGYDPTWNDGTVVSIRVLDPGNCTSGTTFSVALSGGGGNGAAATAQVETDAAAAGDLQYVQVTSPGSGYTSNPTVTLTPTAGSCNPLPIVSADIFSPVMDGGTGMQGGATNIDAMVFATAQFSTLDHLEFKNWLFYNGSTYSSGSPSMLVNFAQDSEWRNLYVHHFAEFGPANSAVLTGPRNAAQTSALNGVNNNNFIRSTITNSIFDNYESEAHGCDNGSSGSCVQNTAIFGLGKTTNNVINGWRAGVYTTTYGATNEYLVAGNKVWAILNDAATQHPDSFYIEGPSVVYNNVLRDIFGGAAAFYVEIDDGNSPASGFSTYLFNNVMYGKGTQGSGTSTPPIGWTAEFTFSGATSVNPASNLRSYNNSFYSNNGTTSCMNAGQWYGAAKNLTWNFTLGNNYCVSTQSGGHWFFSNDAEHCTLPNGCGTWNGLSGPNSSATMAAIDPTAVVQTPTAATAAGYSQVNGFAPTSSSSATVTFANSSGSTNLTNLCSSTVNGVSLSNLCYDIKGVARPATGGWQAGAYQFSTTTLFALSTITPGTGSGAISNCAGNYASGAAFSCSVTASGGSSLSSVTGCGGTLSGTTFSGNMPTANCAVTATFSTVPSVSLTVAASTGGTIFGCASGTYAVGTPVSCTESPASGYAFAGWSGGKCSGTTSACTFSLTANSTVSATFTLSPGGPGGTSGTLLRGVYRGVIR